jgi:hypothetical protein
MNGQLKKTQESEKEEGRGVLGRILFSPKNKEILPFVTKWMYIEDIMLCEISLTQKGKSYTNLFMCGI